MTSTGRQDHRRGRKKPSAGLIPGLDGLPGLEADDLAAKGASYLELFRASATG